MSYLERLSTLVRARKSHLCVGIDPSPETLHRIVGTPATDRADLALQMQRFGLMLVQACRDRAVAVKPQSAWFELAGTEGMAALQDVCAAARDAGLLVVLDAKRGDVPHTMTGYARAYLGASAESGICADALTVNVSIGADALEAAMEVAGEREAYCYALAHTSNTGAAALQELRLESGGQWWHSLATQIEACGAGAVVGVTYPEALAEAQRLMPSAGLLIPGIGAQGGTPDALRPLAGSEVPPLVAAARSVLPTSPHGDAEAWISAIGELVDQHAREIWDALIPDRVSAG
jgi:orotidine-5'-phosphate decarboxylase